MILDRTSLGTWSIGHHFIITAVLTLRIQSEVVGADLIGGHELVVFLLGELPVLAVEREFLTARVPDLTRLVLLC